MLPGEVEAYRSPLEFFDDCSRRRDSIYAVGDRKRAQVYAFQVAQGRIS